MSAPSRLHLLGQCVAVTALCMSFQASAALSTSCNAGTNISGSNVAGLPGVCGQIQGSGVVEGPSFGPNLLPATFTVSGAPLQAGLVPVALSGVVAGTGLFGGVTASGDFGQAHIFASANDTNRHNAIDSSSMFTQGNIGFDDSFTVGSSNVEARFTIALDGGVTVGAEGKLYFDLYDVTPYQSGLVMPEVDLGLTTANPSASTVLDLVFLAGHTYDLSFAMEADASASEDFLSNLPASTADLSNTGTLNIDVVSPGESLTFLSGHDYSSNAVVTPPPTPVTPIGTGGSTVPEPSEVSLVFIGLAALASIAQRRASRVRAGLSRRSQELGDAFLPAPSHSMA
jgi:hypothetical protein